jgi:hypothetical protein
MPGHNYKLAIVELVRARQGRHEYYVHVPAEGVGLFARERGSGRCYPISNCSVNNSATVVVSCEERTHLPLTTFSG